MSAVNSSTVNDSDLSKDIFHQIMHSTFDRGQSSIRRRPSTAIPSQFSSTASAPKGNTKIKASSLAAYSDKEINRNRTWSGCKLKTPIVQQVQPGNRCTCRTVSCGTTPWQAGRRSAEGEKAWNRWPARVNPSVTQNQQEQRLLNQLAVIDQCRRMKQEAERAQHRVDARYYICGSQVPLLDRYNVSEADIQRQLTMAEVEKELKIGLNTKHPHYSKILRTNKNKMREKADNKRNFHKNASLVQESSSLKAEAVTETEPAASNFQQTAGVMLLSTSTNPDVTQRNEGHISLGQPENSSPYQPVLKSSSTDGDDAIDENT